MDYTKNTREELIALCKERNIKGYSNKKKDAIILLLDPSPVPIVDPTITAEPEHTNTLMPSNPTIKPLKPLVKWSGGKGDEINTKHLVIKNY